MPGPTIGPGLAITSTGAPSEPPVQVESRSGRWSAVEEHLRTAAVLRTWDLPGGGGHANKFAALFEGGHTAVVKPAQGQADGEEMCRNEVAAWVIARELGWLDLVSVTVLRDIDLPTGGSSCASVQLLWPYTEFCPDIARFRDVDVWRVAILDFLVAQSDRVGNNWLGAVDSGGQLQVHLVDHGYSFECQGRPAASAWTKAKCGQPVPEALLNALHELQGSAARGELERLLKTEAVTRFRRRLDEIVSTGRLPAG